VERCLCPKQKKKHIEWCADPLLERRMVPRSNEKKGKKKKIQTPGKKNSAEGELTG